MLTTKCHSTASTQLGQDNGENERVSALGAVGGFFDDVIGLPSSRLPTTTASIEAYSNIGGVAAFSVGPSALRAEDNNSHTLWVNSAGEEHSV